MDNLTNLGCRASMLIYDARRAEFVKEFRGQIEKLKVLSKRCDQYWLKRKLVDLCRARAEINSIEEEAQRLATSFGRSKKQQSDRIKELLGEDRARMSVNKRSEVEYFLNVKKNEIERLRREEAEESSLFEDFAKLLPVLRQGRKIWYSHDQDDVSNLAKKKDADNLTNIFTVSYLEKKAHKEQPWYEVKEG